MTEFTPRWSAKTHPKATHWGTDRTDTKDSVSSVSAPDERISVDFLVADTTSGSPSATDPSPANEEAVQEHSLPASRPPLGANIATRLAADLSRAEIVANLVSLEAGYRERMEDRERGPLFAQLVSDWRELLAAKDARSPSAESPETQAVSAPADPMVWSDPVSVNGPSGHTIEPATPGSQGAGITFDDSSLATTVRNLLALSPAERDEYRAELAAAPPDDPNVAHDREALRRVEQMRLREAS